MCLPATAAMKTPNSIVLYMKFFGVQRIALRLVVRLPLVCFCGWVGGWKKEIELMANQNGFRKYSSVSRNPSSIILAHAKKNRQSPSFLACARIIPGNDRLPFFLSSFFLSSLSSVFSQLFLVYACSFLFCVAQRAHRPALLFLDCRRPGSRLVSFCSSLALFF